MKFQLDKAKQSIKFIKQSYNELYQFTSDKRVCALCRVSESKKTERIFYWCVKMP